MTICFVTFPLAHLTHIPTATNPKETLFHLFTGIYSNSKALQTDLSLTAILVVLEPLGFFSKGMWKRSPNKGDSGGWKMECQKTLKEEPVEYETILDGEEMSEVKKSNQFEPPDLADQAYEAWRDENRSKEGQAE